MTFLLQVTSPLRNGRDVKEALETYITSKADHLVSYTKADRSPDLFVTLTDEGYISGSFGVDKGYRRQDKRDYFVPNGAIYISSKKQYLSDQSYFTDKTYAYFMTKEKSIDVDDSFDFTTVVGALYFDYSRREQKMKGFFKERYQELACSISSKILIGDSRLVAFEADGYTNLSISGVSLHTFMENRALFLSENITELVISIGINDVIAGYDDESIKRQFAVLIADCAKLGIYIKLTSIPLTLFRTIDNQRIILLNRFLKEIAERYNLSYLDLNTVLSKDGHLEYRYTIDGLHFNELGKTLLFEHLKLLLSSF